MDSRLSVDEARQVLDAQTFSRLLGTRLLSFDSTGTELALEIRPELRQQFGYVHGGVLAYLMDNVITFAGGAVLGPAVLTGGFTIEYVAPGAGRELRARASVVAATSRRAVCRGEVYALDDDGAETLCATGQGTVVASPRASTERVME